MRGEALVSVIDGPTKNSLIESEHSWWKTKSATLNLIAKSLEGKKLAFTVVVKHIRHEDPDHRRWQLHLQDPNSSFGAQFLIGCYDADRRTGHLRLSHY